MVITPQVVLEVVLLLFQVVAMHHSQLMDSQVVLQWRNPVLDIQEDINRVASHLLVAFHRNLVASHSNPVASHSNPVASHSNLVINLQLAGSNNREQSSIITINNLHLEEVVLERFLVLELLV